MKVLHVTRQFYPCIGGVERYVYEIAKRLVKKNISCRVLTLNYNIFDRKQKFNNFEIIEKIEIFRIKGFGYYKKPIPLNLPIGLFKWSDIVHIHDVRFLFETSLVLKNLFKYKLVYSTHGFIHHTSDLDLLKKVLTRLYYKPVFFKIIDAIICVSKHDYNYFKSFAKNVFLIENGIDYNKFKNVQWKPEKGIILYFGRIDTNKGLDLLFNVLSNLKDLSWKLNIVGGGSLKVICNLKFLAEKLGIADRINWLGFLSEDKLLDLMSKSQLCFFPSTYEGFGFTLIEAMAAGCICVANKIPSYCDLIVDGENGFIVDFMDSKSAAIRIRNILGLREQQLTKISQQAKFKTKNYDWENKIEEIIKVYECIQCI